MNWLHNISIKYKLLIIPIVGALGFSIYIAFSLSRTNDNAALLVSIEKQKFPMMMYSKEVMVLLDKMEEKLQSAVMTSEMDELNAAHKISESIEEKLKAVIELCGKDKSKKMLNDFKQYHEISHKISKDMINEAFDFEKDSHLTDDKQRLLSVFKNSIETFYDTQHKQFTEAITSANKSAEQTVRFGIIISIATIIILFITSILITSWISKKLMHVISALRDINEGNGDLTVRIETTGNDEIGELVSRFNSFVFKLQGIMRMVVESSEPLSNLANELADMTSQANTDIHDQKEKSKGIVSIVEQMNNKVTDMASTSESAADYGKKADQETNNGLKVVNETVNGIGNLAENVEQTTVVIDKLGKDSERVATVLEVIRGISDQTNLLALNAAIEAARAGEQGRGFAVVADEVRVLASKTQESVQEIQEIIEQLESAVTQAVNAMHEGQEKARLTVDQAASAGESLHHINSIVSSICDINLQIASSAEEQRTFSEKMLGHVHDSDKMTDKSADSSRKLSYASEQLQSLAQGLHEVTGQFKI